MKELEIVIRGRTGVVEGPEFIPSQSDVQNLLAAIFKIETKEKTPKDEGYQPKYSPTRKNWRLSKVLDSLANLCVSKTKHEVISIALQVDDKANKIELIIASNTNVQSSILVHL
jgi:hypothetical protein